VKRSLSASQTRPRDPASRRASRRARGGRVALLLFAAVFALYAMTASGTIASSDGTTMYLLARSITLEHTLAIPSGNGNLGRGGRLYAKAGLGQAVAAAPFLLAGEAASRAAPRVAPFLRGREEFLVRAVTSVLNIVLGAVGVAVLFLVLTSLGASLVRAFWIATAFAVASPHWVYAKSFLTEPLTTACLLLGVWATLRARRASAPRATVWAALAGASWGWAIVTKTAMAAAVAPLAAWAAWDTLHRRTIGEGGGLVGAAHAKERARLLAALAAPLAVCVGGVLWYDAARFGSIWQTGYGAEASPESFSTPLLVGLYGMLLSSGKSVFLYCPLLLLSFPGFALMLRRNAPERSLAIALCTLLVGNLCLYARFMSWAGEGSWGPRYLVPFIPLALIPVAMYLARADRMRHAVARALTLLGLVVTLGGVFIYFGAYLRAAGEYPYTREFTDPRFMADTHWNPAFNPVVGHWRLLLANLDAHAAGRHPRVDPGAYDSGARTPLDAEQTTELLGGFDLWWCYLWYAGAPLAPALAVVCLLVLASAAAWYGAWRIARAP
jgi:hypothetical protein